MTTPFVCLTVCPRVCQCVPTKRFSQQNDDSVYLFDCLSVCLSMCTYKKVTPQNDDSFTYLIVCPRVCQCVPIKRLLHRMMTPFICLTVCPCVCQCVPIKRFSQQNDDSVYLFDCLSVCLSMCTYKSLLHRMMTPFICLTVCPCV